MSNENPDLALSPWPAPARGRCAYHAMIKPIGAICNLDRTYCYYLHKKDLLGSNQKFRIATKFWKPIFASTLKGKTAAKPSSAGRAANQR